MILNDTQIEHFANEHGMISPFERSQIKRGLDGGRVISYGLSSFGYDMRITDTFEVFRPRYDESGVVDPKTFDMALLERHQGATCIIPPNSFALAQSREYFRIPRDIICVVLGKSTYARTGVIVNVTPLEPGWHGFVTLEISNTTPLPVRIWSNEGIAQVLFLQGKPCRTSYNDRAGKYQNQQGVTPPIV